MKIQNYGNDPISVRNTDHYVHEYVDCLVDKWDELIDWDRRNAGEGNFFINKLNEYNVRSVLDVATGTGFHSLSLLKAGFDVTSADGSSSMLKKAIENVMREGLSLHAVQTDWRYLSRDIHNRFDAVICLGNSFTHLFTENDRRKALAEFYSMLKFDGILIVDQRNYDAMLDFGFSNKHLFYYCGKNIQAEPEYIDEGLARFVYKFPDNTKYNLNMFPLRKEYTCQLLREAGFQHILTFPDFKVHTEDNYIADYFIHIAEKNHFSGKGESK